MSYILDALKKADAERERSAVPGLHAHPQDGLAATLPRERPVPWLALALGAIVLLGGGLAWVLLADGDARSGPGAAAATDIPAAPPPTAVAAPAAPATSGSPTAAAGTGTPPTVVVRAPEPPPAPPAPPPALALPRPEAGPASPAQTAAPAAAAPGSRLPTLAELPADVRAGLPPLAVSGAVYSPTPSARMVFIGGQVLREGDAVANGVVVEHIGPTSTVLSAHGRRFELKH